MIVKVITLGCKVNQCESASIITGLNTIGVEACEGLSFADVYVLNTCSVTAEADRKSRQYISKLRKLNPHCKIIVVGCSSQNSPSKFAMPNIVAVGGTVNKSKFVIDTVKNILDDDESILYDRILYDKGSKNVDKIHNYCYDFYPKSEKTRAFIKIQDGCNRFCNYCIIPYLRGRSRSRSILDIKSECEKIKSKEIVLTGIDVSSFGLDTNESLTDLFIELGSISARKRLSSLECEAITEPLLHAMSSSNFCPHFHLSLQSGSDTVLRSMNRKYDTEFYYGKLNLIRKIFPLAAITTDVIVGFPTETDEEFDLACNFIKKCQFADIHIFPYSRREGTLAAKKYKDKLASDVIDLRENCLLQIKKELKHEFILKNLNTQAAVYNETIHNNYTVGYTPNYIKVYSNTRCGEIVNLRLVEPIFDGILGVPVSE